MNPIALGLSVVVGGLTLWLYAYRCYRCSRCKKYSLEYTHTPDDHLCRCSKCQTMWRLKKSGGLWEAVEQPTKQ